MAKSVSSLRENIIIQVNNIKMAHKELTNLLYTANETAAEYEDIARILQDECENIEHSLLTILEIPDESK